MTAYELLLWGLAAWVWLPIGLLALGALYSLCDMLVEAVSYWIS